MGSALIFGFRRLSLGNCCAGALDFRLMQRATPRSPGGVIAALIGGTIAVAIRATAYSQAD